MKPFFSVLALSVALLGAQACCGMGGDFEIPEPTQEVSADGTVAVPNINGLRAEVPENATPNGIGGAAGFHTDDDSFGYQVEEAKRSYEEDKEFAQELFFTSWITDEQTDDGWVLTYESITMDMDGNEKPYYRFIVVKDVGGTKYSCYGGVPQKEQLDANVKSCKSLKAG